MSGIEWTDLDWNVVGGCRPKGPGCDQCQGVRALQRVGGRPEYHGLVVDGEWTGAVRLLEHRLELPLTVKTPKRIFVTNVGDLFEPALPDPDIERVFDVMRRAEQHTFQSLTKCPKRMATWCAAHQPASLANVWLGTSVEDQRHAELRVPVLLDTPAAIRWLSVEPLLGPVDLAPWIHAIDWVVVGGESGPRPRPIDRKWVADLRDACSEAGVPFLFKQWGANIEGVRFRGKSETGRLLDGRTWDEYPAR